MKPMKSRNLFFIACFLFLLLANLYFTDILLDVEGFDNAFFSLRHVQNSGAAFSILQNAREFLIISASAVLTLIFAHVYKHSLSFKEMFFTALLCAGVAGNLHERIQLGFVRDFFKLNFIDFPVFNISDIFISAGVVALIILIITRKI